jgi:hypothetical protein
VALTGWFVHALLLPASGAFASATAIHLSIAMNVLTSACNCPLGNRCDIPGKPNSDAMTTNGPLLTGKAFWIAPANETTANNPIRPKPHAIVEVTERPFPVDNSKSLFISRFVQLLRFTPTSLHIPTSRDLVSAFSRGQKAPPDGDNPGLEIWSRGGTYATIAQEATAASGIKSQEAQRRESYA